MMGPFKCPECGVWWAGLEHRCRQPLPASGANQLDLSPRKIVGICTCPPNRGSHYVGNCPVHDRPVTIRWGTRSIATNAVGGPQTYTPRGVS